MTTQNKGRVMQSIYVLSFITSILLFFLCYNVHANEISQSRSVPMDVGTRLTRLALVHKIDSLFINDLGESYSQYTKF